MPNQNESPSSFSIHPELLLSVLDDASALVDRRRNVRAMNPRMERLFASDDLRRIPFTEENGHWRIGPSSRLDEHLQSVLVGIEDVIVGTRERFEVDLGDDGGMLLAIACSIEGARGTLVRIRLRTAEEEHRARCVEIVDAMQLGLFVYKLEDEKNDSSLRCVYGNPAAETITRRPRGMFVGKLFEDALPRAREAGLVEQYARVATEKVTRDLDFNGRNPQTDESTQIAIRAFPLSGQCVGAIFEDVTERMRAQGAMQREMALRDSQAALLELVRALSTPLLPIADGVIVAPLVGQIDEARGAHFVEVLLEGIQRHSARVVLIDITGVPSIDAAAAEQLMRAARAARLLGTRTALVGISPQVARTMVEMGFETAGIETYADLRAGMRLALNWGLIDRETQRGDRPKR